jgi:hypothetical protein
MSYWMEPPDSPPEDDVVNRAECVGCGVALDPKLDPAEGPFLCDDCHGPEEED